MKMLTNEDGQFIQDTFLSLTPRSWDAQITAYMKRPLGASIHLALCPLCRCEHLAEMFADVENGPSPDDVEMGDRAQVCDDCAHECDVEESMLWALVGEGMMTPDQVMEAIYMDEV